MSLRPLLALREIESEGIVSLKVLLLSLYEGDSLSLASREAKEARKGLAPRFARAKPASRDLWLREATPSVMRARERETKDVTKRAR